MLPSPLIAGEPALELERMFLQLRQDVAAGDRPPLTEREQAAFLSAHRALSRLQRLGVIEGWACMDEACRGCRYTLLCLLEFVVHRKVAIWRVAGGADLVTDGWPADLAERASCPLPPELTTEDAIDARPTRRIPSSSDA